MEKTTLKQAELIWELSERFQKTVPKVEDLTMREADAVIKDLLKNGKTEALKSESTVNPLLWGMTLKLVYQNWIKNGLTPTIEQVRFREEVERTYLLFDFD